MEYEETTPTIEEDLDAELERNLNVLEKENCKKLLHELYDEAENCDNPERLEQLIEEMKDLKRKERNIFPLYSDVEMKEGESSSANTTIIKISKNKELPEAKRLTGKASDRNAQRFLSRT